MPSSQVAINVAQAVARRAYEGGYASALPKPHNLHERYVANSLCNVRIVLGGRVEMLACFILLIFHPGPSWGKPFGDENLFTFGGWQCLRFTSCQTFLLSVPASVGA